MLVCEGPLRFVPLPPTDEADERRRELIDYAVRREIARHWRRNRHSDAFGCLGCAEEIAEAVKANWRQHVAEFA